MHELEQRLRRACLAAPSPELDQRINALFATVLQPSRPPRRWSVPEWWTLAVSAGMAAVFVIAAHLTSPPPPMRILQVEPEGYLRDMLLAPAVDWVPHFELVGPVDAPSPRAPSSR